MDLLCHRTSRARPASSPAPAQADGVNAPEEAAAGPDARLLVNVLDVGVVGVWGDVQPLGDLGVREPLHQGAPPASAPPSSPRRSLFPP